MILPHGLQKVFGIWGGAGLDGIMNFFTTVVHIPAWLGYVAVRQATVGAFQVFEACDALHHLVPRPYAKISPVAHDPVLLA
jgi:hypothetical protein